MKHGPMIFLAAFFALSLSWFGFVLKPQSQIGRQMPTNTPPAIDIYPQGRPGLARQGAEVYRANGCAACHSQQVRQSGTTCDVALLNPGTNRAALIETLKNEKLDSAEMDWSFTQLPQTILAGVEKEIADSVAKSLKAAGAKAQVIIVPIGPDIARGWGRRQTVAADYLFDNPVMLGSLRAGQDLAGAGSRLSDANWHLLHLYAPRTSVKDSLMPPFRFLFERKKIGTHPSPDALRLPQEFAPPEGFEIVPKSEARALVAYLQSLKIETPLYEAPFTAPQPPPTENAPTNSAATNSPASGANAPATNAPAK